MTVDSMTDLIRAQLRSASLRLSDARGRELDPMTESYAIRELAALALDAVGSSPRARNRTLEIDVQELGRLVAESARAS